MRITNCTLRRIQIPFRNAFSHAAAARHFSDAIIVEISTDDGRTGFGEIQARPYVTGEDNDSIWGHHAPALATQLIDASLSNAEAIPELIGKFIDYAAQPACAGGFDIALHDALDLNDAVDWQALFGKRSRKPSGKCMTIGDNHDAKALMKQARFARLSRCTVVKFKVSSANDIEQVLHLRQHLGADIALRLDGNGQMQPPDVIALLQGCRNADLESIEEPLPRTHDHLIDALTDIHAQTGIDIVADESVCTVDDLARFTDKRAYQTINVRVGKSGGVSGCSRLAKAVLHHDFGIVCGTMVGESAVMLNMSAKFLHHCAALNYVEGIDQTRQLLEREAIKRVSGNQKTHFEWVTDALDTFQTGIWRSH